MRLHTLSLGLHLHHLTAPPETPLNFPLYILQYRSSHAGLPWERSGSAYLFL